MLVRVLICVDGARTRKRLRKLLRTQPDTFVDTSRLGRTPLWTRIAQYEGDLVLVDRSLVDLAPDNVSLLRDVPGAPKVVVLVTKRDPEDDARLTASGCLAVLDLSIEDDLLSRALEGVLQRVNATRSEEFLLDREIGDAPRLGDFVTNSAAMQAFMSVVDRVVDSDATLLIAGETGVGKERLARAIHEASPRSDGPFVAVNCGALPENLLESELFGHAKGSFTGATTARRGWFELSHRGTVLLDEIGEMPLHLQTRLLRVVQNREVTPVGSERAIPIDVRVMSATNRDLEEQVAAKRFREDLFYRLSVISLEVPPLRERRDDIRGLVASYVRYFRARMATRVQGFSPEALRAMQDYTWPGNVRELINVVERCVLLCPGETVTPDDLPASIVGRDVTHVPQIVAAVSSRSPDSDAEIVSRPFREVRREVVEGLEKEYFAALLRVSGGRIGEAAKRAGMTTRNLFDKLRKHGLDKKDFKY